MEQSKQKILGVKGLVILIALLSAFVPLSTDLYLPALPGMSDFFGVSADRINLTLTAFMVFYALGTLVWGSLSDYFGRRPILIIGLVVYVLASLCCSLMWNVEGLVLGRIFQAIGGSATGVVATAIVKDVYSGKKRQSILAIVQSMVVISPVVAPMLGAFLLRIMSWRGVFWTLTIIGVVALVGTLLFKETISQRTTGMLLPSFGRLGLVLKNRGFAMLLVLFSLGAISTLAFVASSTYIYQDGFHLNEQNYSYFFSLNALGMMVGPVIYLWMVKRFHTEKIIRACFALVAVSGVLIFFLGNFHPWVFALCVLPTAICGSCLRPGSVNMMLEQQKGDTGAVSSLMGCTGMLAGSLGMQLISMPWSNLIHALGIMFFSTATISLIAWPLILPHVIHLPGPDSLGQQKQNLAEVNL
ncbi:MAG TPA: multidrug effflux MFS transporter [Longilinea sp.]|nr:multidrug effflux MFS transporter [Longilinea sp.]